MSKYTTEVRFICETAAGLTESAGYGSVDQIIADSREHIFNFNYPIFDATYRPVLESKILRHYYTREISEETVGLWKLRLQDKLNVIMPYYNKLYESELLKFNPFYDVDYTRSHNRKNDGKESISNSFNENVNENGVNDRNEKGESESRSTNTNKSSAERTTSGGTTNTEKHWDLYSDTPQGGIAGIEGEGVSGVLDDNTYLTNARKNTADDSTTTSESEEGQSESTDEGTQIGSSVVNSGEKYERSGKRNNVGRSESNVNNIEEYAERVVGKQAASSYSRLLKEFRDTFLNIDLMIINELADLFFNLW